MTLFLSIAWAAFGTAQASFTQIADPDNDLAQQAGIPVYNGVSWVDYNGDGREDCFVNSNNLYRNDGGGHFTKVDFSPINFGGGNGSSWADYDGDGDLDVMIAATPSFLYQNDGAGQFNSVPLTDTPIDTFNFWSAAWGDYDGDGWLDLALLHPAGFLPFSNPISRPSLILRNNTEGGFEQADTPLDDELAAHTVGTWTDYDRDGDQDLIIGSGEVSFLSKDHLYENQLVETGTPGLARLTEGALAEQLRDGQNWNFIDYDLDGDLDAFVTNYNSSKANDLYRNEEGTYLRQMESTAGTIANQAGAGLNNIWGDFDNDGFQDCIVLFDGQKDRYYHNNSDGTFTEVEQPFSTAGSTRGGAAADYNDDGYLDLMIAAISTSQVGLYQNEGGVNHWFQLRLQGNAPNPTAIGAKVWLKATINGATYWQYREVNSQNTFNGHNSYRLHFGLGDAAQADSLRVEWPDGSTAGAANLAANQICGWEQGAGNSCEVITSAEAALTSKQLALRIVPNPVAGDTFTVHYEQASAKGLTWRVLDSQGKTVKTGRIPGAESRIGQLEVEVQQWPNGLYWMELSNAAGRRSAQFFIAR